MNTRESMLIVNNMFDAFQSLSQNPFHPNETEVNDILSMIHDSILSSESMAELCDFCQEYAALFQEWNIRVRELDTEGLFNQDINGSFYNDASYGTFHEFSSTVPELILKTTAVRMYQLMGQHGIPMSLHKLLDLLEDLANNTVGSGGTVSENREMINKSMVLDSQKIRESSVRGNDLGDEEIDAIEALQKNLLTFPVVFDSMDIVLAELQNFRLLFDDVGYEVFITRIANKKTLDRK